MKKKLLAFLLVVLQLASLLSVFAVVAADTGLTAQEYLQLDNDKTMWLVLKTDDLDGDHSYLYQNETMFWSDKYQAYACLVITDTDDGTYTPSADDLTIVETAASVVAYTGDINKTGKIDANDAQIVYNIYTAYYSSFSGLSMEKFLRADLNGDGTVNTADVLAVLENVGTAPEEIHLCSSKNLVHVEAVAPTCVASGNIEYWYCAEPSCGKKYLSDDCSTEVTVTLLNPTGAHTGGTATCTTQAVCTVCGASYGDLADHNNNSLDHDSEDHWTICDICGGNAGTHVAHSGGTATCTTQATCTVCGTAYGDLAAHNASGINYNSDGHWTYCTVCGGNAGTVTAHTGTDSCTVCSWSSAVASYTVNNVSMTDYKIYTDSTSKSVAISLRKSLTYALDKTLTVATTTPGTYALVVKVDSTLSADQWKYYCEDGKVYILGENMTALQVGYMYFISKYILPDSPPGIVDGDLMTGTVKEDNLVSFNLPTSYESFNVGDGTYTADNIWNTFLAAKNELPDEITVLDHYDPADYPLSASMQIFVAPDGDDSNDGSIEAPVATVSKALSLIDARGTYGGVIWLREGIYNETISLSSYTGLSESPLFIAAYNGEKVSFSGAYHLDASAFSALTESDPLYDRISERVRDRVLVATLSDLGIDDISDIAEISKTTRPIFGVDGVNQTIARFPNDPATIQQLSWEDNSGSTSDNRPITLLFNKDIIDFSDWTLTDDLWSYGSVKVDWGFDYRRITEIDTENNAVITAEYSHWHTNSHVGALSSYFYFFNFIEALDAYGEWYLDRTTSRFYYIPTSDFSEDSVLTLIADTRTATVSLSSCSNVVLKGLELVDMNGYGVYAESCTDVVVDSCYFENSTSNVAFLLGGTRCGVIYSELYDISGQIAANYKAQYTLTPTNNFFQNNYCHGSTATRGLSITSGVGNLVSHNRMDDFALTINGQNNETIIEYNEMNGGRYLETDTGYIYFPGGNYSIRGNHVRYNYFSNAKTAMTGVYFDIRCSGNYVYGNVIEGRRGKTVVNLISSYGSDNLAYNNLLIHGKHGLETLEGLDWSYNQNIACFESYNTTFSNMQDAFLARYPMYVDMVNRMYAVVEELGGTATPSVSDESELPADVILFYTGGYSWAKNNVIVNCTTPFYENGFVQGTDTNYVADGDVGFVDYENGDYRLTSSSSVYTEIPDWEELPYDKMGIQHVCSSQFLTEFEDVEATCATEGQKHHYRCDCGIYYQNADATGVISDPSTLVIAATGEHTDTNNCLVCGAIVNYYGTRAGVYKVTPTLDGQMDEAYLTKGGCCPQFSIIANSYENDDHSAVYVLHDDDYLYVCAKLYDLDPYISPAETVTSLDRTASMFQFGIQNTSTSVKKEFIVGPGFDYVVSTQTDFDTSALAYTFGFDNGALFIDEYGSYYLLEMRLSKAEFGIASSGILKTSYVRYTFNDAFSASGILCYSGFEQCQFWLYDE